MRIFVLSALVPCLLATAIPAEAYWTSVPTYRLVQQCVRTDPYWDYCTWQNVQVFTGYRNVWVEEPAVVYTPPTAYYATPYYAAPLVPFGVFAGPVITFGDNHRHHHRHHR